MTTHLGDYMLNKNILLLLLAAAIGSFANGRMEPSSYVDSIIPVTVYPGWLYAVNADPGKCEIILDPTVEGIGWGSGDMGDSVEVLEYSKCHKFHGGEPSQVESFWGVSHKSPLGLYVLLDSTLETGIAIKIVGRTSYHEGDIVTSRVYGKEQGQWVIKRSQSGGSYYYSDTLPRGIIKHTIAVLVSPTDSFYTPVKIWETKSYYKATEYPRFQYGRGAESYSYRNEYLDNGDYRSILTDECKVSCNSYNDVCYSTQVFPERRYNEDTEAFDTLSLDTVSSTFLLVKGVPQKEFYTEDTVVHSLDSALVQEGTHYNSTELTVVLTRDYSTEFNLCGSQNANDLYGYKPVSFYGPIDGVPVEGYCIPFEKGSDRYACKYKDATGRKYGTLVESHGSQFIGAVDGWSFFCKEGKTSEGRYKDCKKVGL